MKITAIIMAVQLRYFLRYMSIASILILINNITLILLYFNTFLKIIWYNNLT